MRRARGKIDAPLIVLLRRASNKKGDRSKFEGDRSNSRGDAEKNARAPHLSVGATTKS